MCKLAESEWTQCIYGCWEHPKGDAYLQWPHGITVGQFQKFIWLFLRLSISCIIDDRFAFFFPRPRFQLHRVAFVARYDTIVPISILSPVTGIIVTRAGRFTGIFFFFSFEKTVVENSADLKIITKLERSSRSRDRLSSTNLHDSKRPINFRSKKFTR